MDMRESTAATQTRPRPRYLWFPLLVIVACAAWWHRLSSEASYFTIFHVRAVLVCALVFSMWFLAYGGWTVRARRTTLAIVWGSLALWLAVFRPVWNGDMGFYGWRLRFAAAADQRLDRADAKAAIADWHTTPQDYPRFLGNGYWPEVSGVRLETDWKAHPPQEVWRHEIGAGWSSFAIVGNYAFTQEQRGEEELVTCYRVDDGKLVWTHSDQARFDPADFAGGLGGVGPRATPTVVGDKVVTQGGTGIVNCLDARTGRVLWSHGTCEETGADVITWGKAGSPLVMDNVVVISIGAPNDESLRDCFQSSLMAYDLESGNVIWGSGNRKASYATPTLVTIAGVPQIVMINESVVTSHRADNGNILWEYPWASEEDTTATATQPIPLPGDRLLLSKGYGYGASLVQIARSETGEWSASPLWTPAVKPAMKTKFANPVLRDGFVYGLDDVLLESMDQETGAVKWKKRRDPVFGHGQILLVGGTILVLSETGELALVEASPEAYHEFGSIQALDEANVTWNTPALAPPYLLIRNSREAACYRLPLAE